MNKIVGIIFPFCESQKANTIIGKQMHSQTGIMECIETPSNIKTETLEDLYQYTFKVKEKHEDKAKANMIGTMISIFGVVGAANLLSSISAKLEDPIIALYAAVLLVLSAAYMIMSCCLAIHMLTNENETYRVRLSSIAKDEETLRDDYDKCIAQNQRKNIIRNNYIFASYACMRNSLICLFLFFAVCAKELFC